MLNLYSLAKIGAKIEGQLAEVWADRFVTYDQIVDTETAAKIANETVEIDRANAWYREVC
jgi:hypothetical protein